MPKKPLGVIVEKRPFTAHFYNRFLHKYFVHDLESELQLRARSEAADYVAAAMPEAVMYANRWRMLQAALRAAPVPGALLEFGVEKGDSLNFCARLLAPSGRMIHGFDSFAGLPEDWTGTAEAAGKFDLGGKPPPVLPNASLHIGWFADTLPAWLAAHPEPVAFLHIDCDLYSSTRTVLDAVGERLLAGAVVVFDEYFNYHGWRQHEFRAWQEFIARSGRRYSYRGFAGRGKQVYLVVQ